jgi:phenylalanyl-tRNA synthetase beta chain
MKISYNWLKQYIDLDVDPETLSTVLTDIGLEVEGLENFQSVKGGLKGVVVGEVKTCERHPNADKLSVTTVDVGNEELLPIVCGAPNVAAGQKVLVATVGTELYSGDESFTIKKAKIRGEVSEGMICAEDELGLGESHDGIMVLPNDVTVGTNASDYFEIEEDYIFEIGLTPNRSDATSHIGAARDLVAGLNHYFNTDKYSLKLPVVETFKVDNTDLNIDVIVEDTEACPRYSGVTISDVQVKESPDWLKTRLLALGLRPINNIVDITNFVLHETGQPLHAFDADEISGGKVIIKKLENETAFVTLDEIERKLHHNDLMICNDQGGMCIAGVFGGVKSGVDNNTTNVFLESAYFDPKHIRKTSKRHALQTDASFRFERGADPNITVYALKRAALLIKELAGGTISSEIKDVYPNRIDPWEVDITFDNVDRLIGKSIDRDVIRKIITDLEIEILEHDDKSMKLRVPTYKVDVTREVDIIEDILRIYGYNNIELSGKIRTSVNTRPIPDLEKVKNNIAEYLVSQGMTEIMNNSLTKAEYSSYTSDIIDNDNVMLLNPLSRDLNSMRQSLLFGGLESVAYNVNRRISDIRMFEFGKTYKLNNDHEINDGVKHFHEENNLMLLATGNSSNIEWRNGDIKSDIYDLTGIVNSILEKVKVRGAVSKEDSESETFDYSLVYKINDSVLAEVGKVSSGLLNKFDIGQDVFAAIINWTLLMKKWNFKDVVYTPVPKFPAVRRDLSLILDNDVRFDDLLNAAMKTEKKLLKDVSLFDIYKGKNLPEGKKSYAMSFIIQDETKTLTDKVIDKVMKKILSSFEHQFGAELR